MTEETETTTDLVPVSEGGFAVLADPEVSDLLKGADIQPGDLHKLVVPSGTSGAFFTVPNAEGEDEAVKAVECVIAWKSPTERSFYATKIGQGEAGPPDCSSPDGETGFGVRDVDAIQEVGADDLEKTAQACATCPFAQFGSDLEGGKSQACSQRVRLLLFRPDDVLPMTLQVPAASLKDLRQYGLLLLNARANIHRVVTRIELEKRPGGTDYFALTFKMVRKLTKGEMEVLGGLAEGLQGAMAQRPPQG